MNDAARQPMSDDNPAPQAPTAEERDARLQGWSPKDKWRGDPATWVDAPTFLKRAQEINPILRANNKRLEDQVQTLTAQLEQTNKLVKESKENIDALKNFNSEQVKEEAQRIRRGLVRQLKEARESGDVDKEAEIFSQLGLQDAAIRKAKEPPPKKETPPANGGPPPLSEAMKSFIAENEWFNTDSKKRSLMVQSMADLAAQGKLTGLTEPQRLQLAKEETEAYIGAKPVRQTTKVASGNGGGGRDTGGKSYADLPRHYQKACDRFAAQLSGPGKAWKNVEEYRAHYVSQTDFDNLDPDPNA